MPIFLFTDIEGSTEKWEKHPTEMGPALALHDAIFTECLATHGGVIIKHTGDGVFALFEGGKPLDCALEIQRRIGAGDFKLPGGLRVRMALHAGEAEKRGDDYFGSTINRTARVLAVGWGGQILITPPVLVHAATPDGAETEDLGSHVLKDLSDSQPLLGLVHPSLPLRSFPPLRSLSARPNNLLAQSTHFFGRESELRGIANTLADPQCRLLSLIGPGGIGKTRLALQAAADALNHYPDGVFFVALAPLDSVDKIPAAVAAAMRYTFNNEEDNRKQLIDLLKSRKVLLVLDNFEHLVQGADLVEELLQNCAHLKILVTSRERLNVGNEQQIDITGLDVPPRDDDAACEAYAAVRFFIESARRAHAGFMLEAKDRQDVAAIVRMLEGIPLGIELAAAWVRVLSCAEIKAEISKNLDFLSSSKRGATGRHQSLRAVFEYSWNLLSPEERKAIRWMSVFRGGFNRKQAEEVASCSLLLLSALSDKSLVRRAANGRFEMHEILRQFSEEKLKETPGESDAAKTRHAEFFCEFLGATTERLKGGDQKLALAEVSEDEVNVRSAWDRATIEGKTNLLERAAHGLYYFYEIKGLSQQGRDAFGQTVAVLEKGGHGASNACLMAKLRYHWFNFVHSGFTGEDQPLRVVLEEARALKLDREIALACLCLCAIAQRSMDSEAIAKYGVEALEIYRRLGDKVNQAWSLYHLAYVPKIERKLDAAEAQSQSSLKAFQTAGSLDGAAWAHFTLALIATEQKDEPKAEQHYNQALGLFNDVGAQLSQGWTLVNLLRLVVKRGDITQGRILAQQGLALFEEVNFQAGKAWCTYYLAEMNFNQDDFEASWTLGQQALAILNEIGNVLGVAWSHCNLQRIACMRGDYKAAIDLGKRGAEKFRAINDPEGEAVCLRWLGVAEDGLGREAEARAYFLESLSRFVALRINWRILELLGDLGNLRLKNGDAKGGLKLLLVMLNHPETSAHMAKNITVTADKIKLSLGAADAVAVMKEARELNVELAAAEILMRKG